MLNYSKIAKIADELANEIDKRTEEEKSDAKVPVPEPSLEAKDDGDKEVAVKAGDKTASNKEAEKKAGLKRLIKLANCVKASKKLTSEQKKTAFEKIAKARKAFEDDPGVDAEEEIVKKIDKTTLSQEDHGGLATLAKSLGQVLMAGSASLSKKGIKRSTRLSQLGVAIPSNVKNITFGWLLNILNDILTK